MRFARTQKVLTFLLVLVAAIPVVLSGEVSSAFVLGFSALVVAGWFLEPPLTRDPRFRRIVTAAIVVILALQLGRAVAGAPLARMGIEFALALLGLKLMSRGSSGDYQQIVILAFLHTIGATIATFDLSYALSFVLFVVLSPPVLALAHLRNEMERRFRHDDRPESRRALGRLLASKRVVSPRFVVATSVLSLPVFAITAILFVGFPRFGLGFLGRLPHGLELGGFTEEVQIGDLDQTRREDTVALRLEPFGEHEARPRRLALKLRGAAFDRYVDDTWKQSRGRSWGPLPRRGHDYPLTASLVAPDAPGFEVLLEPLQPPYLFVPSRTSLIRTFPIASEGVLQARKLEVNRQGIVRYEDEAKVGIRYQVFVTARRSYTGPSSVPTQTHLELPAGTERLADLAQEIAPSGSPAERARMLAAELKRRYRYADHLDPGEDVGEGDTPLDRFLFSRGSGTCEHFASSLTLMLRAVGVPSRLVTGFASAEWNPIGEFYAVRLSSAHAWTEAYIDGRWAALDATPPSQRIAPLAEPSTVALLVDAIQMRWHKYVVGYDASSQMEVVKQLRQLWTGSGSGSTIPDVPSFLVWTVLGAIAALLGIAWLVRWRRAKRPEPAGPRRRQSVAAREATAVYLSLERRLRSLGFERPLYQTPKEFAVELVVADRELSGTALRIVACYNRVRFGGDELGPGEADQLRSEIRSLRIRSEARQ
jgi:transglutaminase-like putative cysteine protease